MRTRILAIASLIAAISCLLGVLAYNLPPLHERLAWRVDNLRAQVYYAIHPPEKVVFVPQEAREEVENLVSVTLNAPIPAATFTAAPAYTSTPTMPGPTFTPTGTPTPTLTPTPIPEKVILPGIVHEYQKMNNCGPATLSMLLSYWGWQGDQRDTRAYLRPNYAEVDDKNVMPRELAQFIESQTALKALVRVGGDIETLKRFLAAGFPVMIEKGFQPPKEAWMGHYAVLNGYDDARGRFISQDSYIMADFPVPYDQLTSRWWRDFNYLYLVAYPPERESEALALLGPHADPTYNYQHAARLALEETSILTGRDLFFAWFNRGTNLLALGQHSAAAEAYDQAFAVYASLPEEERPWRTLWYQTGPYEAYYAAGRYQDVINLANTTLSFLSKPVLEETYFWRGLAKEALGDLAGARKDWQRSVSINPTSTEAADHLRRLPAASP